MGFRNEASIWRVTEYSKPPAAGGRSGVISTQTVQLMLSRLCPCLQPACPGRQRRESIAAHLASFSSNKQAVGIASLRGGGVNTHQGAEICITPWWTPFQELHISAGTTHHPNLNPEGDAGLCWSLPETSKLNETSRTPAFSARTAAILMRH